MRIYISIFTFLLLAILASCVCATKDCGVRDISGAKTDEEIKILKVGGLDWMRNAMVCQMGEFEIAVPVNKVENSSNVIFLFKKGKPVFYRENSGTYIYSPKLKDASFERAMVHIWHGGDNDDVNKIWYQTVGNDSEVMTYDTNFDGQPDLKTIWKNNKIIEMYEWKSDQWQFKEVKKYP